MFLLTEIIYTTQNKIQINNAEMPMLEVSKQISPIFTAIYGIMTGIAIFTSAISAAHSLTDNLKERKKAILLILCITAIPISTISFSSLINLAYPIFGLLGIIQIIFILKPWKKGKLLI